MQKLSKNSSWLRSMLVRVSIRFRVRVTHLQRERWSNGMSILQGDWIVETCYESGGKDLWAQNSAADWGRWYAVV